MPAREAGQAHGGADADRLGAHGWQASSPLWALGLLLLGLLATAATARHQWIQQQRQSGLLQQALANAAQARMRQPLDGAAMVLRSMQTVFLASEGMDQQEFAHYQQNLRPHQLSQGYVLTAFAQREASPDPSGAGTYRYQFVAPLEGNEVLLGFDISRQPENLRALQLARDRDLPTASAPFQLMQFQGAEGARRPRQFGGALCGFGRIRNTREHRRGLGAAEHLQQQSEFERGVAFRLALRGRA